ncbi:MAG: ADP-ribosylglycohydrolase family protein [Xanthomonadaceae bacterium]|nr:ADP-ribosylglycohydrolase family protein [Xanthomonadaceae bacterium]
MAVLCGATVFDDALEGDLTMAAGRFEGLLVGMAVGDSLGLPCSGWSRQRVGRYVKKLSRHHRPVAAWGLCGDSTECAWMAALALLARADDASSFAETLAWRLRVWSLMLPIGSEFTTVKAGIRSLLGMSPGRSGGDSAGGALARALVIGAFFARRPERIREMVRASTQLTHTDVDVEESAWVIAIAAACTMRYRDRFACIRMFFDTVLTSGVNEELAEALVLIRDETRKNTKLSDIIDQLGSAGGVGRHVRHIVPAVIAIWLCHFGNYRAAVENSIGLGGITDVSAALAGGLAGITCGRMEIPSEWIARVIEWPASVAWMSALAMQLENRSNDIAAQSPRFFWPALPLRNLVFLCVRLTYRCRRSLPLW